jgi:hypothetical protein
MKRPEYESGLIEEALEYDLGLIRWSLGKTIISSQVSEIYAYTLTMGILCVQYESGLLENALEYKTQAYYQRGCLEHDDTEIHRKYGSGLRI